MSALSEENEPTDMRDGIQISVKNVIQNKVGHNQGESKATSQPSSTRIWIPFLVRRTLGFVGNLAMLVLLTFFIVQLIPGDPASAIAGDNATTEQVEQVRKELGLDRPMIVQLGSYIVGILHGDFGTSFRYGLPATQIVLNALPYTLVVAGISIILVLVLGVGIGLSVGVLTRGDRNRWLDTGFNLITGVIQSIPAYLQATFLVLIFAIWLKVLPPAYSMAYGFAECTILPVAALSIGGIASIARIVRRETSVVQEREFMRTARGWRLSVFKLYVKHLLPNILTAALTLSGILLTSMLGSSLIVETVFSWPGLGSTIIQAIAVDSDYPVIQASVFFIGAISALFTLLIDIVLGVIDPRTLGGHHE